MSPSKVNHLWRFIHCKVLLKVLTSLFVASLSFSCSIFNFSISFSLLSWSHWEQCCCWYMSDSLNLNCFNKTNEINHNRSIKYQESKSFHLFWITFALVSACFHSYSFSFLVVNKAASPWIVLRLRFRARIF